MTSGARRLHVASELIVDFGEDARIEAEERAYLMLAIGDVIGFDFWVTVGEMIWERDRAPIPPSDLMRILNAHWSQGRGQFGQRAQQTSKPQFNCLKKSNGALVDTARSHSSDDFHQLRDFF